MILGKDWFRVSGLTATDEGKRTEHPGDAAGVTKSLIAEHLGNAAGVTKSLIAAVLLTIYFEHFCAQSYPTCLATIRTESHMRG